MIHAVWNFLRLIEDSTLAEGRSLKRLSDYLDRLLIAYGELTDVAPFYAELRGVAWLSTNSSSADATW